MEVVNLGEVGHIWLEDGHSPLWYRWYVCNGSLEATGTCAGKRRAVGRALIALARLQRMAGTVVPLPGHEVIIRDEEAWKT